MRRLRRASAREILREIRGEQRIAYTTLNGRLDRLYRMGLLVRSKVAGAGGQRYLYAPGNLFEMRATIVKDVLEELVSVFGPSVVPIIYEALDKIGIEEPES